MSEECLVPVSPKHKVLLAPEYHHLISNAPDQDYVVRSLAHWNARDYTTPIAADLVIASRDTRAHFPLAAQFPLHFRKRWLPGSPHSSPETEFNRHMKVTDILTTPPPIGWTPDTFRSCFLPGQPYTKLSPFGAEPEERNIRLAHEINPATAAGLWRFAEEAFRQLRRLHDAGVVHGNAELHNFIVCLAPLELFVIDFAQTALRSEMDEVTWEIRERSDLDHLLREAIYLQCALGRQHGDLAGSAWMAMDRLVKNPARFKREIGEQASVGALPL